ncbi:uncharacterized protein LOC133824215 [Humulus lupulus]|uniref:uncharacterized protein LOC133824215 n=1 Tax=Humulus lupulus TaxID=3486 RepID=UPI002B40774C|nr:uncharacterized protein LOC133824215 [Humulus lupulus]
MGPRSAKRKGVRCESAATQECNDDNPDLRLQRRLRRKGIDAEIFNSNSHSNIRLGGADNQKCGEADSDLRSQRRLKRERLSNQLNPISSSRASKAIKKNVAGEKLELLEPASFSNIRCKHGDYDCNDVAAPAADEEVDDPGYIMFLKNLRKNGNSYSVEFVHENGMTELINYDVEEDKRPSMRFGSVRNQVQLVDNQFDHEDELDEEYNKLLASFLPITNDNSYITPDSRDNENDGEYCRFIDPLSGRTSGHSNLKHGFEADCNQGDEYNEYLSYLDRCVLADENTMPEIHGRPKKSDKVVLDDETTMPEIHERSKKSDKVVLDDENTMPEIHESPKKSDKVEEIQLRGQCDQEDEFENMCPDYLAFLDFLEKEGEETMFSFNDSTEKLDQDEEEDLEIVTLDKDPHVESTRINIDLENLNLAEDGNRSQSQSRFKKELMDILKSPYDPQQHRVLWHEVSCRRPKVKEINLRSQTKSCPLENSFGKSYLDQYKDFAEQIELFKYDELKSLNLLRGFFHWLKNLSHDGVLAPWKDPSFLECWHENN